MRAITYQRYGGPEVLEVSDVPRPTTGPGQIVVDVKAASINSADYRLMRADPFLIRLAGGLTRPKKWPRMGSDYAGVVTEVGPGVTRWALGDRVFGDAYTDGRGTFADAVCVSELSAGRIPDGVSFEAAACAPLAGITALQALRDAAAVQAGESVCVYGAGGGVGGFCVQLAVAMGARVTAVCGSSSVDRVRAFGADNVLDYSSDAWPGFHGPWDVILAVNGQRPLGEYKRALTEGGRLVLVGGTNRQIFGGLLFGPLVFAGSGRRSVSLHVENDSRTDDLATLAEHLATRTLAPIIDRTWPLERAAEAIDYVETQSVNGKVVLVP